jgi:general secretion pathway protein H
MRRLSIGRKTHEAGFTLLELLVVLMLLSLTAVAVALSIPDISDRMVVGRAANRLEAELENLAETATRSGTDQPAVLTLIGSSLTLQAGDRVFVLDPTIEAKWTAAVEAGSNQERATIMFWGLGGASGGTFELQRGAAETAIDVDWLTGKVKRRK